MGNRRYDTALTAKERQFVQEYLSDSGRNATQAAIRAGYKAKTASASAYELLKKKHVRDAVEARMTELAERCAVSVESVTKQLLDDRELAHRTGQAGAAVSASMGLAKLHGLIVDKKAETTVEGKPLPPAEIRVSLVPARFWEPENTEG